MLNNDDCKINGINNSTSNNWRSNKQSVTLRSSDVYKKSNNGSLKSS